MGFTAVDGLMMGTRTGALDPGVLLYLHGGARPGRRAASRICSTASPACWASRASRPTCAPCARSTAPEAREAIDLFVYRIVREIGSLAAALGGVDAIVFTAGIGEHDRRHTRRGHSPAAAGSA